MADGTLGEPPHEHSEPEPLGSWTRLYVLVCVLAVAVMALLWWFSAHYNVRLPS